VLLVAVLGAFGVLGLALASAFRADPPATDRERPDAPPA
jgi:hypothetical protein